MYHALKPEGIERRKAFIVGSGIARLAATAFVMDETEMPGENIANLEAKSYVGGAIDGVKGKSGYLCRGERELEDRMECLWYLCSKVPSMENPGRTVLDDVVD